MKTSEIRPDQIWGAEKKEKLKEFIKKQSLNQSEDRIIKNKLLSIQYKIEDYIRGETEDILEVHHFIKMYLEALNITQKKLAQFLGMRDSNFHKYVTGKRKINADLAFKFGYLFDTKPEYWYRIEVINELNREKKDKTRLQRYEKYNIIDLVRS